MKRTFLAQPADKRCRADRKPLRDGSGAQCMLPRLENDERGVCGVHARMLDAGKPVNLAPRGCSVSSPDPQPTSALRQRYFRRGDL